MTVPMPPRAKTERGVQAGRWRWWYAQICDLRIQNPGIQDQDIAARMGRSSGVISAITRTDVYREYEAQRMQDFREKSEEMLRLKLLGVASVTLDSIKEKVETKRDQLPLDSLKELGESVLDRLGFAPQKGPSVAVQVNTQQNFQLPGGVSPAALDEARQALRAAEQKRIESVTLEVLPSPASEVEAELNPGGRSDRPTSGLEAPRNGIGKSREDSSDADS